ncbi:MAG: hypothetical protein RBG1_1C00001G1171 [candidate division Zixibacteria bacterium RBG-1]|nr:MAG: hypothetical protein RBG1_1C00001G1171 [candidate division Zixibacteria bacterium RBG-1]OGC84084.1 MAG: hypothetical protein A2V73_00460 [candidate division Zixibacteria bacterium RBG_19FT_COMBO_42_43]
MKCKVKYLTILLLLFCVSYSNAQISVQEFLVNVLGLYDFTFSQPLRDLDFLGGGARARGMGGAFLALSDDASAASWNPAGLVQLDKIQTSFSLLTTSLNNQYDNSFSSFSFDKTKSTISYASFLLPLKLHNKDFVGNIIFNQAAELRDNYIIPVDSAGNSYRNDLDGKLNYVGIGVGGRLFSGISLGATVNIYGGGFTNNKYQVFDPYGDTTSNGSRPEDDTLITARPVNKASYSAANVTLGLLYQKSRLRLALIGKTPLTLKESDDVHWLFDITIRGVTNPQSITQPGFLYKTVRKWKIPFSWGLGASYSVTDNLTLAADLETRYQGRVKLQYQVNALDPVSPSEEISIRDLSLNNVKDYTNQIRLGGEYMIPTMLNGKLFLRGGYRNQPKTLSTAIEVRGDSSDARALYQDPTQLITNWVIRDGTVKGNVYTFGVGWSRAQIKLDFGVEFSRLKVEHSGFIFMDPWFNPFNVYTFTEENKYNVTRLMFNFTGYF